MRRSMMTLLRLAALSALSGILALAPPHATAATPAASERVLVTDAATMRVLEYDALSGAFVRVLLPPLGGSERIQHLAIGPDGAVYLSLWADGGGGGSVRRYGRANGALIDTFIPNGRGGLDNPDQLVFANGMLYVSDRFSGRILRYSAQTGAFIDTIVEDERLFGFIAFAIGPDGHIYASMFNHGDAPDPATFFNGLQCVLRYNGQSGAFIDAAYCPSPSDPDAAASGLAFAGGSLYVARYHAGQVVKVNPATRQVLATLGCPGDDRADQIGFGPDGALYVSNFGDANLRRIDVQSGACQTNFFSGGNPQIAARFVFAAAAQSAGRVQDGLLALYDFDEGSGATVADSSGVGSPLNLTIANPQRVTWASEGLRLDSPVGVVSAQAATKINDAARASNEITIELWVVARPGNDRYSARMLTISADEIRRNVTLTQGVYDLQKPNLLSARIRTSLSGSGSPALNSALLGLPDGALRHVVFTRGADGTARLYQNGVLQASGSAAGTLATWRRSYRLSLGDELTGNRPWLGTYSLAAVYGRALSAAEVQRNFTAGPDVP